MDERARDVVAAARTLLGHLREPIRLLTALDESLAAVAGVLQQQAALTEELGRLETAIRRHEAESASRVKECQQREDLAEHRHADAEAARQRDRATLEQTIETIKAELSALKTERQGLREALRQARDEHAAALALLAREKTAAEQAVATAREQLAKIREGIPA